MNELAKKKDSDLLKLLAEKKQALQDLEFSFGKSKPGEVTHKTLKKDIARILTELNKREKEA